jgi:hypothetical protein
MKKHRIQNNKGEPCWCGAYHRRVSTWRLRGSKRLIVIMLEDVEAWQLRKTSSSRSIALQAVNRISDLSQNGLSLTIALKDILNGRRNMTNVNEPHNFPTCGNRNIINFRESVIQNVASLLLFPFIIWFILIKDMMSFGKWKCIYQSIKTGKSIYYLEKKHWFLFGFGSVCSVSFSSSFFGGSFIENPYISTPLTKPHVEI